MKTGWANDNGTWYYMQPSGAMKTGWANDNGTWYYMQPSGAMKTGWVNDAGTWYYLQASGAMKTGWINDNGTWYFAAASGAMQTGVVEVDGKVYYLAPSGAMATGNVNIKGVTYTFDASGAAVGDKIPTPTVAFKSDGNSVTPTPTPTPTPIHTGSSGGDGGSTSSTLTLSDLSDGGSHTGNCNISTTGTFGASDTSKVTTINGNISITDASATEYNSITLQNLNITGTLTVNFGKGNLILDNVIVNGVDISNVGSHSLHVRGNSSITTLKVNDTNNDAHIVVEENASIANTTILTGAQLEVAAGANANAFANVTISPAAAPSASNTVTLVGGTFGNVTVSSAANVAVSAGATLQTIVANSNLVLSGTGTINNVTVNSQRAIIDLKATSIGTVLVSSGATGAALIVSSSTAVATLNINAPIAVTGTGTISTANLGVSGITIETKPTNVVVAPGVTATVGGETYNDITPLVSSIYSAKLASSLQNHPTLAKNISVTTGDPIVVTLLDSKLDSIQTVFNTAQSQNLSLIEARLSKAEEIMDLHSTMLNVGGVSFKQYLAQAEANYVASGGKSTYFKNDGSFDISAIAERIEKNTLTYDEFKTDLKDRIIAMCDETKKAPQVSISDGTISETVTKIQKDGTTIYDTSLSIDTNINGLVSLGDTTKGTYTIYCGTNYFTVKVS